ncbi:MAG: SIP domain-containing protein [Pseudomonadota bacterium]
MGDETALPVIARMIEAAPAGTQGEAVIMVRDPADAQKIVTASDIALRWTKMDPARDPADILTALRLPAEDRYIFFAAEKAQATRAREVFKAMGLAKGEAKAASYWSLPREG